MGALRLHRLGVVRFIHHHDGARFGKFAGQACPAVQTQLKINGRRFPLPVGMQPHRGDNQKAQRNHPQQRSRCQQRGERFTEPHLVGEKRSPTGEEPTGTGSLMGKRPAAIDQGSIQISLSNQLTVMGQRRQGVPMPMQPAQELILHAKAGTKTLQQSLGSCEREFPTQGCTAPEPARTDAPHLRMGDRIEGIRCAHKARWRQPKTAARRRSRRGPNSAIIILCLSARETRGQTPSPSIHNEIAKMQS